VNRDELHRHFYNLGVGAIEEVRVQQEKGFGFIRYSTHGEAALAIQMANGLVVRGKPIKVTSRAIIYFAFVPSLFLAQLFMQFHHPFPCYLCSAHGATNQHPLGHLLSRCRPRLPHINP
uniref:RRM domain-containing protein n=1 Tax=Aegilops tauschii subsp. strangulata TaxID=200361 RepID=A0A453RL29_AEGTS